MLIQAVQGHIQESWEVLIQDIHFYFQSCNHVIVNHIFRESNRAVDWLAKFGLTIRSTEVWNDQVSHRDFHCVLVDDNLGRTLKKRAA